MGNLITLDKDSFSSGQVSSKIWLCEELENNFLSIDKIAIYGGWYGLTAFLIRSRNKLGVKKIYSYDIDPSCETIADSLNENWVCQEWAFKAFTQDCNKLDFDNEFDLVINTSTEHFDNLNWFNNIPKGIGIALQGADMPHDDHVYKFNSLDNFKETFKLTDILYSGEMEFDYPDWSFKRFMLIGFK